MSVLIRSIKAAAALLTKKGSRVKMITAGILATFSAVFPMMIGTHLTAVIDLSEVGAYVLANGVTLALGLFITLPAAAIFYTYAQRTYSMAKYGYSDTKKKGAYNYFRSLLSAIMLFIRPVIALLVIQGSYVLAEYAAEALKMVNVSLPFILILLPLWGVAFVAIALFAWVTNSVFLAPYYYSRGMSAAKAISESRKKTVKHPFYCDLFSIVFIGLTAVSLFTFGVLFVLWVLPLMMFTYFELAERMDGSR